MVSAFVSCLTGRALEWANAMWREGDAALDQFEEFTRRFRAVFDHPPEGRAVGERLYHLRQETRSAQEFALEFRNLAAGAGGNNRAMIDHYRCSLCEDVRQELACRDTTLMFDQLVDLSIRLDNLLATLRCSDRGLVVPSSRTPLRYPWSWEGRCSGRPEGVPGHAPSVVAEVTADRCRVGSYGNRGSRRAFWRHPR